MSGRTRLALLLAAMALLPCAGPPPVPACCPAPPPGKPVVNADQTVILIWDAATKTQHFIRQASFKSDADDFGFLIPSPAIPDLEESGNAAFPYLFDLTKPEVITQPRPSGGGCGCSANLAPGSKAEPGLAGGEPAVVVHLDKQVANFHARVLEAKSAQALVGWLKEHGYAFSPEVEAWARPYVEEGWMITALQVAKDPDGKAKPNVSAAALRMSFKTARPLFPYREPDSAQSAAALGAQSRLLRIYFLSDARYRGELTEEAPWTGKVAWANKLSAENRQKVLELLKLPETTGPAQWWLTEFEDNWPYRVAPADVYFAPDADQSTVKRPPIIRYVASPWPGDVTAYALAAALLLPPLIGRLRRRR
jgi:hypothetical protein